MTTDNMQCRRACRSTRWQKPQPNGAARDVRIWELCRLRLQCHDSTSPEPLNPFSPTPTAFICLRFG